ncbi:helix-turn-helix domain-containing protein [Robertkochia flava]|uniref:helix-turn-helix domain-containing protein n=1 Tax=Robertkochia flava TaxID=3447986 RepID=UPI001CCBABD6|nr:helix-turn-helix domain-containing protein [Robertkochia marina]
MYLIFYPGKFFPNRILGVLVLSWSVTVFVFILHTTVFYERYPHLYALLDVFTLMFFPLMYLYLRNYLYRDIRHPRLQYLHFIPALLYLIMLSPFFFQSAGEKLEMMKNGFPSWYLNVQLSFNLVIILQGIFYSIFCLRTIHQFKYFRKNHLSPFQLSTLKWLQLFVLINIFLWMVGTTGAILEIAGIKLFLDLFKVFYSGLTLFTIVLGIFTIKRPELFSEPEDLKKLVSVSRPTGQRDISEQNMKDYEVISALIEREKPYLKNDLKMQDLVESTGITYRRISEVFNKNFNKSFYEVMNEYRLNEAKILMQEGFHKNHTLSYLAEKAGFNSKTTFNRIFKKFTGITPTDYIKDLDDTSV